MNTAEEVTWKIINLKAAEAFNRLGSITFDPRNSLGFSLDYKREFMVLKRSFD